MKFKLRQMGAAKFVTNEILLEMFNKSIPAGFAYPRKSSISFIGKVPRKKKKKIMRDFKAGKYPLKLK